MCEKIRKLCWWMHRLLCYLGIHASDVVGRYDEKTKDFVEVGTLCPVCMKIVDWEEES